MNLALVAGPQEQIEAARYFMMSERPQLQKAVLLYHKAGLISKAVDLAFKSGQVAVVAQIAGELDESADPQVIQRCSEYFISIKQFDKAVNLLITGKQVTFLLCYYITNLTTSGSLLGLSKTFFSPFSTSERWICAWNTTCG